MEPEEQRRRWREATATHYAKQTPEQRRHKAWASLTDEQKERAKARAKRWKVENRERWNEIMREWRAKNHEAWQAYDLAWAKAHPERQHNRRARIKTNGGRLTADDVKGVYKQQRGRCAYCPKSLKLGFHIDHIQPVSRGGGSGRSNSQLTCSGCNQRKSSTDPMDFARKLGRLL